MAKPYTHLTTEERDRIALLRAQRCSQNEIAERLRRNPGTISREFARNGTPVYAVYLPHRAQARAAQRKSQAHQRPRLKAGRIRAYVVRQLARGWSPERIAGRLRHLGWQPRVSPEAIYQFVYDPRERAQKDLVPCLARAHRRRKRCRGGQRPAAAYIPHRVGIETRPSVIERRRQLGHWEVDTVDSRQSLAGLGVAVERASRRTVVRKLERVTAAAFRRALTGRLRRLPHCARRTLTYDNGRENVEHEQVNAVLGTRSYFCTPYHSWEKGTVENAIGLIRRFLPKGTDFATVSPAELQRIERWLNTLPRKCLGYRTPEEVFNHRCCT